MGVIEETTLQKILRKSEKKSVLFSKIRNFLLKMNIFFSQIGELFLRKENAHFEKKSF